MLKGPRGVKVKTEFVCVVSCDYRYLNKYTRADSFPTSDIADVISNSNSNKQISIAPYASYRGAGWKKGGKSIQDFILGHTLKILADHCEPKASLVDSICH